MRRAVAGAVAVRVRVRRGGGRAHCVVQVLCGVRVRCCVLVLVRAACWCARRAGACVCVRACAYVRDNACVCARVCECVNTSSSSSSMQQPRDASMAMQQAHHRRRSTMDRRGSQGFTVYRGLQDYTWAFTRISRGLQFYTDFQGFAVYTGSHTGVYSRPPGPLPAAAAAVPGWRGEDSDMGAR